MAQSRESLSVEEELHLPSFANMPSVKGMPPGTAWGLFDHDGQKDVLGCLNLLTPLVVRNASQEVSEGVSISLNLPLDFLQIGHRKALKRTPISLADIPPPNGGFQSWDDEVEFNTQVGTQWDSLLHYAHQDTGLCYNGIKSSTLGPELSKGSGKFDLDAVIPSLDKWQSRGGLVARGVLLDYKAWADVQGINVNPISRHEITISDLEAVAEWEGVQFRRGDVLIVRSGFTESLAGLNPDEQLQLLMSSTGTIGVSGTMESAAWFWDHHFAAVAGDTIAFEVYPPAAPDGNVSWENQLVLHQYFLSLFGMSIGELWDLRKLSAYCAEISRYSFMLTSIPLHIPGGVGSPPNAIAIF